MRITSRFRLRRLASCQTRNGSETSAVIILILLPLHHSIAIVAHCVITRLILTPLGGPHRPFGDRFAGVYHKSVIVLLASAIALLNPTVVHHDPRIVYHSVAIDQLPGAIAQDPPALNKNARADVLPPIATIHPSPATVQDAKAPVPPSSATVHPLPQTFTALLQLLQT